jgi:AraC-like DNA-binding protein
MLVFKAFCLESYPSIMIFDLATIHTVGKIAVLIILLLAVFLLTVESRIKPANRLFAIFLCLVAFDMCGLFMYDWLIQQPYVDMLRRSSAYLQMPLVYFYIKRVCFKNVDIEFAIFKHILLFIAYWLALLSQFVWLSKAQQVQFLQNTHEPLFVVFSAMGELQYFFYIYLMFRALSTYKQNYQASFSSYETTAYKWLFQLTCISLCAHLIALFKDVAVYFAPSHYVLTAHFIVSLTVLSVICWLVLKALYHPSITRGVSTEATLSEKKKPKTTSTQSLNQETQKKIDVLEHYMQTNEPYLDPDLSIETLANSINENAKELSGLINQHIGKNFFSYVNAYRIEKAKLLLSEPTQKKRSVLVVLYEVGFNSKSSFNTAFKKHTGQTPSSYRQSLQ